MNILIFDTETTSLEKPFCYNIGYVIGNEYGEILCEKDFVVEQIWHNLPLFNTAYYSDKRPIYVERMRARHTTMDKFGYICQEMKRDIKKFDVKYAYAFNSPFDTKVFDFNCEWFKCNNPFEETPILDIRGNAHQFLTSRDYLDFCDRYALYTESGNYSTTAESYGKYLINTELEEEHTALSDSQLEYTILLTTFARGAKIGKEYKTYKSIPKNTLKTLRVVKDKQVVFESECYSYIVSKTKNQITLK